MRMGKTRKSVKAATLHVTWVSVHIFINYQQWREREKLKSEAYNL